MELVGKNLRVVLSAHMRDLALFWNGAKLPWDIDLAEGAWVQVENGDRTETVPIVLDELDCRFVSPTSVQWVGEIHGAAVALAIELDGAGVVFSISPLYRGKTRLCAAAWPGALRFSGASREFFCSDSSQGYAFRSDGAPWQNSNNWWEASMRFGGFACGRDTLALIVDTPWDAVSTAQDDGLHTMMCATRFVAALGELSYTRRIRYVVAHRPGYVGSAALFRDYAAARGLWVPWEARVERNPEARKLVGAFVACAGYYHDPDADVVGAMQKMKALGFEAGYLFSPRLCMTTPGWAFLGARSHAMTGSQIRTIQDLGYVCAPFICAMQGLQEQAGLLASDRDGKPLKGWRTGDRQFSPLQMWRVPAMLEELADQLAPCLAAHVDTFFARPPDEHWGFRAYDRRGDIENRLRMLEVLQRQGRIFVGECYKDWGAAWAEMGTSKGFTPLCQTDLRTRAIPLFELVYHDSVIRCRWEHHAYDDIRHVKQAYLRKYFPHGMILSDAMTASPPMLFPEGRMYAWTIREVRNPDGTLHTSADMTDPYLYSKRFDEAETQAVLPEALKICQMNRRHGTARMVSHRFVFPDSADVQETEFASGLHVVANFSDQPQTLTDGRTVAPRAYIAES